MFGSAFGFPRFYESPNYYEYPRGGGGGGGYDGFNGYGRLARNHPTCRGCCVPYADMSPNEQHMYLIPNEVPVIHEGPGEAAAEKLAGKSTKPCVPDQRGPLNGDTRDSRRSSQKHRQEERDRRPYPVKQAAMNEMDVSDDEDGESFPFYSGMHPNDFGGGFPFARGNSRSRPPTSEMPRNRASPQRNNATAQPKFTKVPAEKASSQEAAAASKSPAVKPSQDHRSRTVPIVVEQMTEYSSTAAEEQPQHVRHIPGPVEQLESMKKEMDDIGSRVDGFSGVKEDKEYIFLDEMMTALLLKLDTIESNGVEEIRNRRRHLVRHVLECVRILEQKVGILPRDEEAPSAGNIETSEEMGDDGNRNEDYVDTDIVPLDIPDEDQILGVPPSSHQNEVEQTTSSLTETAISSPVQMEVEKTVNAKNDLASTETVSENLGYAGAQTTELSNLAKETALSQEEAIEDDAKDVISHSVERPESNSESLIVPDKLKSSDSRL